MHTVIYAVAAYTRNREVMRLLAKIPPPDGNPAYVAPNLSHVVRLAPLIIEWLASNPNIDQEIQEAIWNHSSCGKDAIMRLAANPAVSIPIQFAIVNVTWWTTRSKLAENHNVHRDVMLVLADDPEKVVRLMLAENPAVLAYADVCAILDRDRDKDVTYALADTRAMDAKNTRHIQRFIDEHSGP